MLAYWTMHVLDLDPGGHEGWPGVQYYLADVQHLGHGWSAAVVVPPMIWTADLLILQMLVLGCLHQPVLPAAALHLYPAWPAGVDCGC